VILATVCTVFLGCCGVAGILVAVRNPAQSANQPWDRCLELLMRAFAESVARGDYGTAGRFVELAARAAAGPRGPIPGGAALHRKTDGAAGSGGGTGGTSAC
jgi:hypothetical protein